MTDTNRGAGAPEKAQTAVDNTTKTEVGIIKERIRQQFWLTVEHVFEGVAGMVETALLFIAIALVAAGLGYGTHWAAGVFTWLPQWMFTILHGVEYFLFLVDIVGLVWSVIKHIKKHF